MSLRSSPASAAPVTDNQTEIIPVGSLSHSKRLQCDTNPADAVSRPLSARIQHNETPIRSTRAHVVSGPLNARPLSRTQPDVTNLTGRDIRQQASLLHGKDSNSVRVGSYCSPRSCVSTSARLQSDGRVGKKPAAARPLSDRTQRDMNTRIGVNEKADPRGSKRTIIPEDVPLLSLEDFDDYQQKPSGTISNIMPCSQKSISKFSDYQNATQVHEPI